MSQITLTTTERTALLDVLDSVLSDLGMEIAATDTREYREELKARRDLLSGVRDRLAQTE